MSMALKEKARQSGLVLSDEKWNETDLPPLEGGWRWRHASVVLNHPAKDKDINNSNNGQTVVVVGGYDNRYNMTKSVHGLNLADPNKLWCEGPPMNQSRQSHAAVVCNGGVYVMGGGGGFFGPMLDCMERIDANDLLQSFSSTSNSTHETKWTTLDCRLSTGRRGCRAVAVYNRYIVVMGGSTRGHDNLSSVDVDVVDTSTHTVTAGPSMTVSRSWCASAVVGHRIFVIGGSTTNTLVEYLDFTKRCDNEERNDDTLSTVISFSAAWKTTLSDLVLSDPGFCLVASVGSCLVVAEPHSRTVQVLDTLRNRVWNLPSFGNFREVCSMVTFANQIAVIGGDPDPTCATLPLMDKNTWCFCRLCGQPWNERYHSLEGSGSQDVNVTGSMGNDYVRPCLTSTLPRKRAWPNSP